MVELIQVVLQNRNFEGEENWKFIVLMTKVEGVLCSISLVGFLCKTITIIVYN